jgi:hypothetical protein
MINNQGQEAVRLPKTTISVLESWPHLPHGMHVSVEAPYLHKALHVKGSEGSVKNPATRDPAIDTCFPERRGE